MTSYLVGAMELIEKEFAFVLVQNFWVSANRIVNVMVISF
jgi:hypothetical protein